MNILSFLRDKLLLYLLHLSCMMALAVFLRATVFGGWLPFGSDLLVFGSVYLDGL